VPALYLSYMNKEQRLVLIVSVLASFVAFLDSSVVNVALPAIAKHLGGGLVVQQWVVDAYLLTLGALILIAGSLSDLLGHKKVLNLGLVGFGITSLLCALAPSSDFLIAARALQGIAGALLVPSSLALIISNFEGKSQSKAIGRWTAWTGISFIVGPLLGGLLVDTISWRAIFIINIFPIALTLRLITKLKKKDDVEKNAKIDWLGAITCTLGLGLSVFALIEQPNYGWGKAIIFLPFIIGVALLIYFIYLESKIKNPMVSLSLFKVRNFSVGNIATAAIYAGLSIATFLIIITLQQVSHYSALDAGLALMPVTLIMFFLSPRFGALAGKYGPRLFMSVGPLIASIGFLLMLRIHVHADYASQVLPAVIVFGLGLSMTVAPLTSAILSSIPEKHAGVGSAINNAVARIAGLIAIAVIGLVTGKDISIAGFHHGVIFMAILILIGAVISALGISNKDSQTSTTT
jgi:EmrB/QacA subfamily drug resistance transporter